MKICSIQADQTYEVRQQVLRPGRDPEECKFAGDLEENTLHLGVLKDDNIIGVASFMKNSHPSFSEENQFQLRGMAVLDSYKKTGLGRDLLLEGENLLKLKYGSLLLWFNARETALGFYKKFQYKKTGPLFMIPNVCMHQVMYKNL